MDIIERQTSTEKEPDIPIDDKIESDSQSSTKNETIEKSDQPPTPSVSSNEDLPVEKPSGSEENKKEELNEKEQSFSGIDSKSQCCQDETKEIATKIDTSDNKDTIENSHTSVEGTEMKTDGKEEVSNVEKSCEIHDEPPALAENEECKQKPIESTTNEDYLDTTNDVPSIEDSEYETPEPDEEDEEDENDDDVSETGESSTGSQVLTEREEGDGEESDKKDGKKKDKDEDKRDPQYIPKKGNFYEHDDRTAELEEVPAKKPIPVKSFDSKEMWGHDMYNEDMQSPKSRQELIDQYGYDIRDEEGPPKARRRRKYGRGPNKYTRRWEEVDAYVKTRGSWRGGGRGGRGRGLPITAQDSADEFPPLPQTITPVEKEEVQEKKSEEKKKEQSPLPQRKEFRKNDKFSKDKDDKKDPPFTGISGRGGKKSFRQVYLEEQVITPSRGRGRGRGRIPANSAFRGRSSQNSINILSQPNNNMPKQSTAEEDIKTLSQHFSEAVINVDNKSIMPTVPQQNKGSSTVVAQTPAVGTVTVTPTQNMPTPQVAPTQAGTTSVQGERIQSVDQSASDKSESKSKRYSTQRQRSLPQGAGPVQQPPPQRYMQDQYYHQGIDTNSGAPPPQYAQQPPPPPQPYPPEVPMMAFIPPGGQFQPLYVPPPPYIPTAPLPVQAPPPRPDVYQGASGITYYSPQSQVNRPVNMSRRVKLAIPIVAPPESS